MLDVLRRDPKASFFFIGANDERDEPGKITRRFRVYVKFVSSIVGERLFEHHKNNELSLYILVNKTYVADTESFAERITKNVVKELGR